MELWTYEEFLKTSTTDDWSAVMPDDEHRKHIRTMAKIILEGQLKKVTKRWIRERCSILAVIHGDFANILDNISRHRDTALMAPIAQRGTKPGCIQVGSLLAYYGKPGHALAAVKILTFAPDICLRLDFELTRLVSCTHDPKWENRQDSYAQAANNAKFFTSNGTPNSYSDIHAHRARITDVELEFLLSSCRFDVTWPHYRGKKEKGDTTPYFVPRIDELCFQDSNNNTCTCCPSRRKAINDQIDILNTTSDWKTIKQTVNTLYYLLNQRWGTNARFPSQDVVAQEV